MKVDIESLHDQAVNAAVHGEWEIAVKINKKIISADKKSTDALLRLGFAHFQLGQLAKAKAAYLKGQKNAPSSPIAINNLEKIRILEKKDGKGKSGRGKNASKMATLDPNLFINIVGKTKVVSLINIGQASVLARLKIGQPVNLKIKRRKVEVRTEANEYIGALPDDISRRLILFLDAGTTYMTYIKEASKNIVDVFLAEEKKGRKVAQYTSFPKNIQDDIRLLAGGEDEEEEKGEDGEDLSGEDGHEEAPVDLEKMAEEVVEAEYFPTPEAVEEEEEE